MGRSFQECIEGLQKIALRGYGKQLPGQSDEIFSELAEMYMSVQTLQRNAMRDSIPQDCLLVIVGFSDRFATLADRNKNAELLRKGYLAHAIEGFRYDERENILRLALLAHVARKLDLNPIELLDWAAELGSDEARSYFARFKERSDEINTIETMGIKESTTKDGVVYEYIL